MDTYVIPTAAELQEEMDRVAADLERLQGEIEATEPKIAELLEARTVAADATRATANGLFEARETINRIYHGEITSHQDQMTALRAAEIRLNELTAERDHLERRELKAIAAHAAASDRQSARKQRAAALASRLEQIERDLFILPRTHASDELPDPLGVRLARRFGGGVHHE